ncbi:MAG TPA: methyltransferase [Candidatus Binataceae bacterium]|nr:methyltransferase [Candidatus Binataceae bacterium]
MDFSEIVAIASGHAEARAIQVALKLGVFEALAKSSLDEDELARAIGAEPRGVRILADALVAIGFLGKDAQRFRLDSSARDFLVRSSPRYVGDMILFEAELWDTWEKLEETVRTGKPSRIPDMFQGTPQDTSRFIRAMDSIVRSRGDAEYVAGFLDLSDVRTIADLAGGPGTYMAALAHRWPALRPAIWDLGPTLNVAREILAERESEIADRIALVEVDYLRDELPHPVDMIFMSNVIHSEDEETNAMLMRKCFRALAPGGTLIIKDHIMNEERTEPRAGAVFALYLMLTTKGRDYSFNEVARWLSGAGFGEVGEHKLPMPPFTSSLVTACKP